MSDPIPMILHCPQCHVQHIDTPDDLTNLDTEGVRLWTNPPHRSHLCHNCGCIWRPCDLPTTGVATIQTKGKIDTYAIPPV